jgi:hypothetical protein
MIRAVLLAAVALGAHAAQEAAYYEPMGKEMMWLSAAVYCPREQVVTPVLPAAPCEPACTTHRAAARC